MYVSAVFLFVTGYSECIVVCCFNVRNEKNVSGGRQDVNADGVWVMIVSFVSVWATSRMGLVIGTICFSRFCYWLWWMYCGLLLE